MVSNVKREMTIDRPGALVIVVDTFRREHLEAYADPSSRMPCLNEFARSTAISGHHVLSSFPTVPAGADVLTGRFAYTHRGWESLPRYYLTMRIVETLSYVRNSFG
jgi:arylsulfatase A-like enzyme